MIIVRPEGGLCNRLRVIASALTVARREHQKVVVVWHTWDDMQSLYTDVFNRPNDFVLLQFRMPIGSFSKKIANLFVRLVFSGRWPNVFHVHEEIAFKCYVASSWNRILPSVLSTFNVFEDERSYEWLIPRDVIQRQVKACLPLARHRIGVHIRRTDQVDSKRMSPLHAFYARIDRDLSKDESLTFFLSTDDDDVREYLTSKYPGRVFARKNVMARYSADGVCDGVVDLLLLASTRKIYGSCKSSFSEEAGRIGGVEVEWILGR